MSDTLEIREQRPRLKTALAVGFITAACALAWNTWRIEDEHPAFFRALAILMVLGSFLVVGFQIADFWRNLITADSERIVKRSSFENREMRWNEIQEITWQNGFPELPGMLKLRTATDEISLNLGAYPRAIARQLLLFIRRHTPDIDIIDNRTIRVDRKSHQKRETVAMASFPVPSYAVANENSDEQEVVEVFSRPQTPGRQLWPLLKFLCGWFLFVFCWGLPLIYVTAKGEISFAGLFFLLSMFVGLPAFFILVVVLLTFIARNPQLEVARGRMIFRNSFSSSEIVFSELRAARWWPETRSIELLDDFSTHWFSVRAYGLENQLKLIRTLRNAIPRNMQTNWDAFCHERALSLTRSQPDEVVVESAPRDPGAGEFLNTRRRVNLFFLGGILLAFASATILFASNVLPMDGTLVLRVLWLFAFPAMALWWYNWADVPPKGRVERDVGYGPLVGLLLLPCLLPMIVLYPALRKLGPPHLIDAITAGVIAAAFALWYFVFRDRSRQAAEERAEMEKVRKEESERTAAESAREWERLESSGALDTIVQ